MASTAAKPFQTEVKKLIRVPTSRVFSAWSDTDDLNRWFTSNAQQDFRAEGEFSNGDGDSGQFLSVTPNTSIHFTWSSKHHEPGSDVLVSFESQGDGCLVTLRHSNLASQKDAEDLFEGWSWALEALRSYLETGKAISFQEWKAANA